MARPGGLGKGLGALIPTGRSERRGRRALQELPIGGDHAEPVPAARALRRGGARRAGRLDPRGRACSSRCSCARRGDGYELIAGERRWRAARRVGLQTIPALVRDDRRRGACSSRRSSRTSTARSSTRSRKRPPTSSSSRTSASPTTTVAARVGKSRATVTNTLRLLQLPPSIQRYVQDGTLRDGPRPRAARHARPRVPGAARRSAPSTRTCRSARSRRRSAPATRRRRQRADAAAPTARRSCARRVCSSSRSCSATTSRRG